MPREGAIEHIECVPLAHQLGSKLGELLRLRIGKQTLPLVAIDAVEVARDAGLSPGAGRLLQPRREARRALGLERITGVGARLLP